ncbi:hypothetical protein HOD25_04110 [archaeon]|jgi:predicted nucleotidyltransferase|nr:hypothetical protein [archaeon]
MKLNNEETVLLRMFKDFSSDYNANNLSKLFDITSMGVLKILKRLEEQGLLVLRKVSNIKFYDFNFESSYARDYISLLFRKEASNSSPSVKRWINEIRKIKNVEMVILFGSVLTKGKNAKDIDVLFLVKEKSFGKLKEEIRKLNLINDKKIHAVYQTKKDFVSNLKNKDEVVLDILKGVVVFGEKELINILGRVK